MLRQNNTVLQAFYDDVIAKTIDMRRGSQQRFWVPTELVIQWTSGQSGQSGQEAFNNMTSEVICRVNAHHEHFGPPGFILRYTPGVFDTFEIKRVRHWPQIG